MLDIVEYERQLAAQDKTDTQLTDIESPQIVTDFFKQQKNRKPKNNSSARPYCFSLISYIDEVALSGYLSSAHWIHHYTYAHHKFDVWNDEDERINADHKSGTLKEPHTHVLIYTYNGKSVTSVKKLFDRFSNDFYIDSLPQNTLCQACSDPYTMYRYHLHLDDKDKYQYDESIRCCDDQKYWDKFDRTEGDTNADNKSFSIVNMLLSGVPLYKITELYGKEFTHNYRQYRQLAADIVEESRLKDVNLNTLQYLYKKCLSNSDFTDRQKQQFFKMFAYIQTQLLFEYADKEWYEKNT